MPAAHIVANCKVPEKLHAVLCACQYAETAEDYAGQLTRTLARVTRSAHAIWLNAPAVPEQVVAQTDGARQVLGDPRFLFDRVPVLYNDLDRGSRAGWIAAAPVLFRKVVAGVLAVAGRTDPYTREDLELLIETGRSAVVEYESLKRAEELGLARAPQRLAHLVHDLRQPLSAMEAHACYLDLILEDEPRVHEHLAEMQLQIEWASQILDEGTHSYVSREVRPRVDGETGESEDNLALTNSAMSMVT